MPATARIHSRKLYLCYDDFHHFSKSIFALFVMRLFIVFTQNETLISYCKNTRVLIVQSEVLKLHKQSIYICRQNIAVACMFYEISPSEVLYLGENEPTSNKENHGLTFFWPRFTHCGFVTPRGFMDFSQHWFRQWHAAWWHNVDLTSVGSCAVHAKATALEIGKYHYNAFEHHTFEIKATSLVVGEDRGSGARGLGGRGKAGLWR